MVYFSRHEVRETLSVLPVPAGKIAAIYLVEPNYWELVMGGTQVVIPTEPVPVSESTYIEPAEAALKEQLDVNGQDFSQESA